MPLLLWPVLILGNLAVSILFAVLTSQLVYVGSVSPDRVVRVRLYKYMARVPLAATIPPAWHSSRQCFCNEPLINDAELRVVKADDSNGVNTP